MAIKIIDEKNLPPANVEEIEFAKNAKDCEIDTSDIPPLSASELQKAAALAKKNRIPTVA